MPQPPDAHARAPVAWALAGLAALCLAARLPGLRSLPIFGDEAIKLHWAQLVREDPIRYALVSMVSMESPWPPLHSWLLALALPLSEDPLRAGRLLSVFFGALTVPFLYLFCAQLATTLATHPASPPTWRVCAALTACVLSIFCPYLALHQRLAMVEAIFVFESVVVAWLALKIARAPDARVAIALGVAMGAALLTRQNLSYLLSILPVLAFVLVPRGMRPSLRRFIGWLLISVLAALGLWLPVLLKKTGPGLAERLINDKHLLEPMSAAARLRMASANAGDILGWLWTYMTPPILLLSVFSIAWLLSRRQWRLCAFLLGWLVLILGPLILFGRYIFSRYGVLSAIPLLVACGVMLASIGGSARFRTLSFGRRKLVPAILALLVLFWPVRDIALAAIRWREQPLVPLDRWQFVSGWPAGAATEGAVAFLRQLAMPGDVVLLVPRNEGNPMDTLWLSFYGASRVRVYSVGDVLREPLLRSAPGRSDRFLVDEDPWRRLPARVVTIPEGMPVFYVSPDPVYTSASAGAIPAGTLLRQRNPKLQEVARFWNPPIHPGRAPSDGVVLWRVR